MNETEADIRVAFASLRKMCDPRGHGLLDALEDMCVDVKQAQRVFACDPDESCGMAYELDDPKSNGYHDRLSEIWDSRPGK